MATSSLPPTPGKACRLRGQSRQRALNKPLVCATIVAGIAAWLAGSAIYPHLADTLPRPVLIGLLFGLLCALTTTAIMMVGRKMVTFEANLLSRKGSRRGAVGLLLLGGILLTLLAMLFEWVYEIEATTEQHDPTSYVFVVDDSGSMEGNDPNRSRFAAIPTVLGEADDAFPFMVYRFSNEVGILRDMAPASDGIPPLAGSQEGGTSLKAALNAVLDDRAAGRWEGGAYPRVILLSDGVPTDTSFFDTLNSEMQRFAHAGISVSTVGLGGADDALMQRIARATGGVYVRSPDAEGLAQAMSSAAIQSADRDLLSARYVTAFDGLYAALRVLFLFLLGAAMGALCALAYGSFDSVPLILATSAAQSLIGAVAMEAGVGAFGLPAELLWLALWVLMATTIALVPTFAARIRQRGTQRPLWGDLPLLSVRR